MQMSPGSQVHPSLSNCGTDLWLGHRDAGPNRRQRVRGLIDPAGSIGALAIAVIALGIVATIEVYLSTRTPRTILLRSAFFLP
ncbi:hypothetical protein [Bradyrhizobium jicamae]|uniref:hypothetical protein n=1 Tax=Bradyrhizobium jicamae TaxID=280332 RepID=UPI001BA7DA93|nr:hypothetical protein [Bradyrhizobium jicamae]MBR0936079.1 hypothetical protein [Bradyrhizobium jicamae]